MNCFNFKNIQENVLYLVLFVSSFLLQNVHECREQRDEKDIKFPKYFRLTIYKRVTDKNDKKLSFPLVFVFLYFAKTCQVEKTK